MEIMEFIFEFSAIISVVWWMHSGSRNQCYEANMRALQEMKRGETFNSWKEFHKHMDTEF